MRQATPDELTPAVQLMLSAGGSPADARMARDFITFARERGVDLSPIHIAVRDDKMVSAVLPVISPGRTALLLCPGGIEQSGYISATRQLIEPACRFCAQRGVQLSQALVDPADLVLQKILADEGFLRMAELHYLHVQPPVSALAPMLGANQAWVTYSESTHGLFGRTILASYKGSLDCPALNGLRDVEDILAGHKASGVFNPATWFVLMEHEQALGVLLLSQSMRSDALELVYLGIVPEARGRKLGEFMMRQALATAFAGGHARLCLAVDSLNVPALKLYYRHGMQRIGSKVAMLRDLRKGNGDTV